MIVSEGISQVDRKYIEDILRSTGFFYEYEIKTALDIADITISEGIENSGYHWLKVSDEDGIITAFANYGRNDFSVHSWELYWIAVNEKVRNLNLGSILLHRVEENIIKEGGKILWIETSGRPLYAPTEAFYRRNGYELQASLKDFYGQGDPKQIYAKRLKK
jgi:GNAT superfamily N-acetyltransferase